MKVFKYTIYLFYLRKVGIPVLAVRAKNPSLITMLFSETQIPHGIIFHIFHRINFKLWK